MTINLFTGIAILVAIATGIAGFFLYYADREVAAVSEPLSNRKQVSPTEGIVLHTNKGNIEIRFWRELAPNTVENFIALARKDFYDETKFHRVIPGFMIQGGDPLSKDDSQKHLWGRGGPGYTFEDEIHKENENKTGTIAMANAGPNTNGSQFFINVADNHSLDMKHTVFGEVVSGMSVVREIAGVKTDESDRPVEPVIIEKTSFR